MKAIHFTGLLLATFIGTLAAMIVWTLIVKNQVQAQIAANPTALNSLSLLSQL